MIAARLRAGQLFALSIGVLVLSAVVGFVAGLSALSQLQDVRRRLADRIDPSLVSAQRFLIAMVDQESGVRGYVVSGDDSFLVPYRDATRRAPRVLSDLHRTARRRQAVQDIAFAARRWQSRYAEPTVAAVQAGRDPASDRRGKALFDAFRARVSTLTAALERDRANARARLASTAGRVRTIFVLFAIGILLATLLAAYLLRRFVVAPVRELADQVRTVSSGDFEHRVEVRGAREVAELGADVDAMRAQIVAERDDLRRSNAELEQFAYVASHDLQEPLRKVASFTQMLQRRYAGQLDERADQYIDFAVDGATRMQDLINDLLAFSRVGREAGGFEPVDLGAVAAHALADLDAEGATVEIGELPVVCGKERLLEAVLANLLANALKFRGDEPLVIRVSARRLEGEWCFTVADNGIGIDPEYADRIFVIFQRLHARSAYEGTGIGLAMCRKIVEHHSGRIWLDDGVRRGATFHFTLPEMP